MNTDDRHRHMLTQLRKDEAGNPIRPIHPLNDLTVRIKDGAVAQSMVKDGPNYLAGIDLRVVAVVQDRVMLAGPVGGATANLDDLHTRADALLEA